MTDKLFDSFVKNKLENYESPVPNGLWEKIIAEEKEDKPIVIWWWSKPALFMVIALVIMGIGSSYYVANKKNSQPIFAVNQMPLATLTVKEKKGSLALPNANNSKFVVTEKEQLSIAGANEKLANKKEEVSDLKIGEKVLNHNIYDKIKNDKIGISIEKLKKVLGNNKQKNKEMLVENWTKIANTQTNNYNNKQQLNLDNNAENENEYNAIATNYWGNIVAKTLDLHSANKEIDLKTISLPKLFAGTDDCPTARGTLRNDWYVEGYVSPDIALKKVSSSNTGNDIYLSKKDSSETMQLGFTIGARFSKSITNNLLLKAGLQYSQFNEKFTLRTENDRRQTIVINTHTIVRAGQPDTTISDTTVTIQIGYRVRSNINRYKNLEVPIILSYDLSLPENKWQFALNGGAILNLTSWYEGRTIDANYNTINIAAKANNGIYKSQIGVSIYGGVSILRKIDDQIAVFAEPYLRYGLTNSLQSNAGFTQKFNVFGVQFGARIKINKNKHL